MTRCAIRSLGNHLSAVKHAPVPKTDDKNSPPSTYGNLRHAVSRSFTSTVAVCGSILLIRSAWTRTLRSAMRSP